MLITRNISTILIIASAVTSLLVSRSVYAGSVQKVDASQLNFGLAYKNYSMALPSQVSSKISDDHNQFSALALIVSDDFNEFLTLNFEAAKGLSNSTSGYNFEGTGIRENYTTELDYSLSVQAKFRLLENTLFRPYLLLGANAAAVSYDYQQRAAELVTESTSETLTSTGLSYGAGIEFITAHNVNLSLSYEQISHFKYDTSAVSFDAIWKF